MASEHPTVEGRLAVGNVDAGFDSRASATRTETVTHKIEAARTGFKSSIFLHVEHLGSHVVAIRVSEKGRDDSTLDKLLHALGDEATDIVREITGRAP